MSKEFNRMIELLQNFEQYFIFSPTLLGLLNKFEALQQCLMKPLLKDLNQCLTYIYQ